MVVDPESQKLWNELHKYEPLRDLKECCKKLLEARQSGLIHLDIHLLNILSLRGIHYSIKINYCPECGRRLE